MALRGIFTTRHLERNGSYMAELSVTGESSAQKQKISTIFRTLSAGAQPRSCSDLLSELKVPAHIETRTLAFEPMNGRDVYNITAPFHFDGKMLLAGRVEKRETEFSEIVIFEESESGKWKPFFTHPDFQGLQDPCVTWAGDELVLGGVRFPVP